MREFCDGALVATIEELEDELCRAGKHLRNFRLGELTDDRGRHLYAVEFRFGGSCHELSIVVGGLTKALVDATKREFLMATIQDIRRRFT